MEFTTRGGELYSSRTVIWSTKTLNLFLAAVSSYPLSAADIPGLEWLFVMSAMLLIIEFRPVPESKIFVCTITLSFQTRVVQLEYVNFLLWAPVFFRMQQNKIYHFKITHIPFLIYATLFQNSFIYHWYFKLLLNIKPLSCNPKSSCELVRKGGMVHSLLESETRIISATA